MQTRSIPRIDTVRWYREPWPWLIMLGPAIVVVAGIATAVIAVKTDDGLVADDYYRQGLAIDKDLAREARAEALGIGARIEFDARREVVRISLQSREALPGELRLTLAHPTRAGQDQAVTLAPIGSGLYEGRLAKPHAGDWLLQLQDGAGSWRVSGRWQTRDDGIMLGSPSR